jgi:hypothetical protein
VGISMFIPGFPLDSYFDLSFPYGEERRKEQEQKSGKVG